MADSNIVAGSYQPDGSTLLLADSKLHEANEKLTDSNLLDDSTLLVADRKEADLTADSTLTDSVLQINSNLLANIKLADSKLEAESYVRADLSLADSRLLEDSRLLCGYSRVEELLKNPSTASLTEASSIISDMLQTLAQLKERKTGIPELGSFLKLVLQ